MPVIRLWIHFVWCTKFRKRILNKALKAVVFRHIRGYAAGKKIYVDTINGHLEHVHCLIKLRSTQSAAGVMKLIKGESSHWINLNKLTTQDFEWQPEYYAASVSPWDVARIRKYIRNQEKHHRKRSLDQELDDLGMKAEDDGEDPDPPGT